MSIDTTHWPKHPTKSGWLLKNKLGEDVRIVCVDGKAPLPLVSDDGDTWTESGGCHSCRIESKYDLIIPKLASGHNPDKLTEEQIRAKCVELLAIVEKRTPGKWVTTNSGIAVRSVANELVSTCNATKAPANAAFIASCAGHAEAGWKATIAAIDAGIAMGDFGLPLLKNIITEWEEIL